MLLSGIDAIKFNIPSKTSNGKGTQSQSVSGPSNLHAQTPLFCLKLPLVPHYVFMALARLRGCTGSPEPSLFAHVISTIFTSLGPGVNLYHSYFIFSTKMGSYSLM